MLEGFPIYASPGEVSQLQADPFVLCPLISIFTSTDIFIMAYVRLAKATEGHEARMAKEALLKLWSGHCMILWQLLQ